MSVLYCPMDHPDKVKLLRLACKAGSFVQAPRGGAISVADHTAGVAALELSRRMTRLKHH